eukprot:4797073-Amphidinium_carterae.1
MYVGVGPSKEYVLDFVAQQNIACFEEEAAGHVSCCCAFHPFTRFGIAPAQVINGIDGFDPPARVAAGRRLTTDENEDEVFDICKEAWTAAAPEVAEIYQSIIGIGYPEIIEERQVLMQEQYGRSYCGFDSSAQWDDGDDWKTSSRLPLVPPVVAKRMPQALRDARPSQPFFCCLPEHSCKVLCLLEASLCPQRCIFVGGLQGHHVR